MSIEGAQSSHKLLNLRRLEANPLFFYAGPRSKTDPERNQLAVQRCKVLAIWPFAEP